MLWEAFHTATDRNIFLHQNHNSSVWKICFSTSLLGLDFLSCWSNCSFKSSSCFTAIYEKSLHLLSAGRCGLALCWEIWAHEICHDLFPSVPVLTPDSDAGGKLVASQRCSPAEDRPVPKICQRTQCMPAGSGGQITRSGFPYEFSVTA